MKTPFLFLAFFCLVGRAETPKAHENVSHARSEKEYFNSCACEVKPKDSEKEKTEKSKAERDKEGLAYFKENIPYNSFPMGLVPENQKKDYTSLSHHNNRGIVALHSVEELNKCLEPGDVIVYFRSTVDRPSTHNLLTHVQKGTTHAAVVMKDASGKFYHLDSPEGYGGPYNFSGPFHIVKLRKDGQRFKKEERESLLKKLIQTAEKIKGKYKYDPSLKTDIYTRGVEEGRGLSESDQFKKGCESVCKSIEGGQCPPQYCSELVYTLYSLAGLEGLKPEGLRQVVSRLEGDVFSKLNEGEKKLLRQSFVDSFLQDPAIRQVMDRNTQNQTQHLLQALTNPLTGGITGEMVDKMRGPIFFPHNFVDEAKREKGAFCYAGSYLGGSFASEGNFAERAQPVRTSPELYLTLQGHTNTIMSVQFSPDGKKILTGSRDHTVRIWDGESGRELGKLEGHTQGVNCAHFSPDGKKIVTCAFDSTVRIWDVESRRELKKRDFKDPIFSARFSPDGKKIVTGCGDSTAKICIWDEELEIAGSLKGYRGPIFSAQFSPDGKKIMACSNGNACIWKEDTGIELKTLNGHTAQFSPDGKKIVTTNDNAQILNAESGQELKKLEGHTGYVHSAQFSRDGKKVITGSSDKTVRIWDAESGVEHKKLEGHTGIIYSVHFSPDAKKVVTGSSDNTVRIWAVNSVRELTEDFLQNLYRGENGQTLTAERALQNLHTPRNTQIWRLYVAALKDNAHLSRDNLFGLIHNTVSSVAVQEALKRIADEMYAPAPVN
jgi:WD40 repeat protein